MAEGRRGLGRGLSALLDEVQSASTPEGRRAAGALDVPIELIRANPDQPRRAFGQAELDELAASIRSRGVLQPIVAGERRWRAAQQAQLRSVPALVRDLNDHEVVEVALIENIQRSDLNALEEARGYAAVMKRTGYSVETVATLVGKSRSHVANTLRLMRLPPAVREHLEAGRLTAGHARALLDLDEAGEIAARIIDRGLNVRQTEALARRLRAAAPGSERPARVAAAKDADTRALESDLAEALGLEVKIRAVGGAGEVLIHYATLEQLDELCRRLTRRAPGGPGAS